MKEENKIKITKNGPYIVNGDLELQEEIIKTDADNYSEKWEKGKKIPWQEPRELCRCGKSCTKPFCDATHEKVNFDGTENPYTRKKYQEMAEKTEGPELDLDDALPLCSSAKFCDRGKGTWQLTKDSDKLNNKNQAIQQACDCPSGRLVAYEKNGKKIEPQFDQSISVTKVPGEGVSGPLWIKGGVSIESSDGFQYEKRNRVTLCRCGKSKNKPFCDGTHIEIGFNDGNSLTK